MDCQNIAPLIESYLANELTPTAKSEMMVHLTVCAACRACVADFAQLDDLLREMPREVVRPQLTRRIQQQARARALRGRIGHVLPVAMATLFSALLFVWLASETWFALQDRALWEFVTWFVSVPEILWRHPGDVLVAFTDFAPISGVILTLGSALSSSWLAMRLVEELRNPLKTAS